VTETTFRADGYCGDRQAQQTALSGRSNGVPALPFLCFLFLAVVLVFSAGAGTPRNFMAPARAADYGQAKPLT
jgi:hypothetical protein